MWHVQYTDEAKAQLETLSWEDIGQVEDAVKRIAGASSPLQYGSPVGDFHERRLYTTPPVQIVTWAAESVEVLTVVEIVFPDALAETAPEPPTEEPPQQAPEEPSRHVPAWVSHPLGVFEEESALTSV